MIDINMKELATEISLWIKNYATENKINALVVGLSGGVDSGLVSTLCAMTGLNTILVMMPCQSKTHEGQRAINHAQKLQKLYPNVSSHIIGLTSTFLEFKKILNGGFSSELAEANSKSRLRMLTLYHIACYHNGIVVGTGNKIEDFGIGFFTKYGDGGVDISPIGDLLKSEVRQMCRELGVDDEITNAVPTDGLWEGGHTDEDQIGASYDELEWALKYDTELSVNEGDLSDRQKKVLEIYRKRHNQTRHKMLPIPVFTRK